MVRLRGGRGREGKPASIFIDAWFTAEGSALQAVVEHLTDAIKPDPKGRIRSPRRSIVERKRFVVENITANLAYLALCPSHVPGNVLAVSTAKTRPTRYDREDYPRRILAETLEALEQAGFLIRHSYLFKQITTTVEPTAKFRELLQRHGVRLADVGRDAGGETILLRARQPQGDREASPRRRDHPPPKRLIHYVDTEETIRLRAEVEHVTATLNAARIAYDGEPVGPIHLYRSFLLRSPEDPVAFNLHGRLWGGFWQHLKSSKRHLISIDGEGIADLDFSAMFAMLAYWQSTGRLPERDPYDIPEFAGHRKGAKLALISLLSRRGSLKLLAPKLKAVLPDGWTARRVVEVMSERHAPIAYMFASDSGLALMAVESKILMAVLLDLAAKGIPALPMFDGINVKISDRAAALASMRRVSARILGVALPVAEKPVWHAQTLATAA